MAYQVRWGADGRISEAVPIQFGVDGMGDIGGILQRTDGAGLRLEIECKTGQAVQNPEQIKWERMIRTMGGVYLLVRTPEEALDQVIQARGAG